MSDPGLNVCDEVLFSEAQIRERVSAMGTSLAKEYADKCPLVVGVLRGAFVFMTDLIRAMNITLEIDFCRVKSYDGTESTGECRLVLDVHDVKDRHVILVEDIMDSGRTISFMVSSLKKRGPASVKTVALLDKPSRRAAGLETAKCDLIGWEIPNKFVVGYGLDYDEKYRNIPYIGVLADRFIKPS